MGKKSKALKAPATATRVPQSREEVALAIGRIGQLSRERVRIEVEMNDQIAKIKESFETQAEPLNLEIQALRSGVQIWCEANRDELTQGGKVKTAGFTSGEVNWRMDPSSVVLSKVAAVIKLLKEKGLQKFIRTKEEVNKDAILLAPKEVAGIAGITIVQNEKFVIVPFETKLDEAA